MNRKKTERRSNSASIYVRKSTNRKQCSISKQRVVIRKFAKLKGLEIVNTFSDEGKI
jgi:DNA invertase Pin-like site-specific DNA recombinase